MKTFIRTIASLVVVYVSATLGSVAQADVKLPHVFGSHMVLQRDQPVVVWGWADSGEAVTVTLDQKTAKCTADAKGKWKATLPALSADGATHRLTVSGKNTIQLDDILVGEVWLGSGQSNMEMSLKDARGAKEAIAAAYHPQIRLFHVPKVIKDKPANDVEAAWKACTPESVPNFSAVLFYFGLKLESELKVPVGLINDSWGGSPIESWLPVGKKSSDMYNGMIAPVKPFAIRGVIWYQGETNAMFGAGLGYFNKMKALVEGWRNIWGQQFPFYFVQIAPFSGYKPGLLPPLWEAQVESLKIPGTGMAVVTDLVDDMKNIHPLNKLDVGERLARWALAKTYGKAGVAYSGPLYQAMTIEGNKIRLVFAHVNAGLKSRNQKALSEFEIAGADGKFVPAEASIDGATVVVQSKDVSSPKQVRFAWHSTPTPNLMNADGLPASPFQTDKWRGGTGE